MTSEACQFSTLDRDSTAKDKTSINTSHISRTVISGSKIFGSIISDCWIENTLITGGKIESSTIINAEYVADNAHVNSSQLRDKMRVGHTAYILLCNLRRWTIFGNAQVINWGTNFVDGHEGYIGRGDWYRPPRILDLNGLTITEGVPNFAYCGCLEFEIDHWLKIGDKYGKKLGLSVEDVDKIRQFLLTLR